MRIILNSGHARCQTQSARYGVGVVDATVLVVNRLRSDEDLTGPLEEIRGLLATADGCLDVDLGRNVDEPELWVLAGRWRNIGSWRRALSSYDVKLAWQPLMRWVIDEAGTYELGGSETHDWNRNLAR